MAGWSGVRISVAASDFSLLQEAHIWSGAYSAPCSIRAGVLSRGSSGQRVNLTTHLHLEPRLEWVELCLQGVGTEDFSALFKLLGHVKFMSPKKMEVRIIRG